MLAEFVITYLQLLPPRKIWRRDQLKGLRTILMDYMNHQFVREENREGCVQEIQDRLEGKQVNTVWLEYVVLDSST